MVTVVVVGWGGKAISDAGECSLKHRRPESPSESDSCCRCWQPLLRVLALALALAWVCSDRQPGGVQLLSQSALLLLAVFLALAGLQAGVRGPSALTGPLCQGLWVNTAAWALGQRPGDERVSSCQASACQKLT